MRARVFWLAAWSAMTGVCLSDAAHVLAGDGPDAIALVAIIFMLAFGFSAYAEARAILREARD